MKLEVGKYYKVRDPKATGVIKVRIDNISTDRTNKDEHVTTTLFKEDGTMPLASCSIEGKWYGTKESSLDLVEEYHEPPKSVWDLNISDSYYVLCDTGGTTYVTWFNVKGDKDIRNQGNAFLTKQEVEKESRKRELETKITKRIAELNEGWVPDWNTFTYKHTIEFAEGYLLNTQYIRTKTVANKFYLRTSKLAEQLAKELETELMEFLQY